MSRTDGRGGPGGGGGGWGGFGVRWVMCMMRKYMKENEEVVERQVGDEV